MLFIPLIYTALQGVDLGRPLGHWFGPNNVAQVIKYVYIHHTWEILEGLNINQWVNWEG